jgi:hypothetical protein
MKTTRYLLAILVAVVLDASAGAYSVSVMYNKEDPWAAWGLISIAKFTLLLAGGMFSFFFFAERWRKDVSWLPQSGKPRPVVRVWTYNGDTIITPDKIYLLSSEFEKQLYVAFPSFNPHEIRITPLIYSIQRKGNSGVSWISPEQARAIFASCDVQRTEMQLPTSREEAYYYRVDFEKMWRLIHGPDAKPPEMAS